MLVAIVAASPLIVALLVSLFLRRRGRTHQAEIATARLGTWLSASRSVERAP
jgi:hypothetical protein